MLTEQVQGVEATLEEKAPPKVNKGWANLRPAQKGEVRNPRGRPKKDYDLAAKAQEHAHAALAALVDVMSNSENPPASRVSAASEILDRGFGRAPADLKVKHEIGFGEQFEDFVRTLMAGRHAQVIEHHAVDAAE